LTNDEDEVEQVKKPSAGITVSRKISTGKYENAEVEAWATTGTLDSDDIEELEQRLDEAGDKVIEQVQNRIKEIQDSQDQLSDEQEDAIDDAIRNIKAGQGAKAANLLQNVLDQS